MESDLEPNGLGELYFALAKAQAQFKTIIKNRINPHFKSPYADLDACIEATKNPLSNNGLFVYPEVKTLNDLVTCTTAIAHSSGKIIRVGEITVKAASAAPQHIGSAITYVRRYSYCAALNLTADEDDDGNLSMAQTPPGYNPKDEDNKKRFVELAMKHGAPVPDEAPELYRKLNNELAGIRMDKLEETIISKLKK